MSVVKRSNSTNWYIQFQLNGKTHIRSSRTTSKKAAEQMEAEWKAKLHATEHLGHREQITVRQAVNQFCESKAGTPNHKSLLTSARILERLFPTHKAISELRAHDLERLKRDRMAEGVAPQTIKHNLNLISCAWKFARKLGFHVNELEFPQIKRPKSPLRYLSEEEERALLAHLDPQRDIKGLRPYESRDLATIRWMQDALDLVVLLLDTGARYGEIANIEWSRINLPERSIALWRPKVQNETVLYMTDRAYEILTRRAATRTGQHVFLNSKGGPRGYVSQAIRKAIRKAGLVGVRIHTLRHTHASRLIQNGMSVYEVREILGHTDIKTTMRYAHLESRQVTSKARDVINRLNQQASSGESGIQASTGRHAALSP